MLEVAIDNEFGAPGVPSRPFVSGYVADNTATIQKQIRATCKQIVSGKRTNRQGLERLGATWKGGMQARIARGFSPIPNAPSTIERKGSSKPLIDTGQLRSSITWQISGTGATRRVQNPSKSVSKSVGAAKRKALKAAKRTAKSTVKGAKAGVRQVSRAAKRTAKTVVKRGRKVQSIVTKYQKQTAKTPSRQPRLIPQSVTRLIKQSQRKARKK